MTRFHIGFPISSVVLTMGGVAACGFPTVSFEHVVDGGASASTATAQPRGADSAAPSAKGEESMGTPSLGSATTGGASSSAATGATNPSTSAASSSQGSTGSTTSSVTATSTKSDGDGNGNGNGHGSSGHGSCADADGDGYAAASCGGTDCNDSDPRANPGVTAWVTAAPAPAPGWLLGDWNCDGSVQVEYQGSISCATLNPASFAGDSCASIVGFADAQPACGATDDTLTRCQPTALSSLFCATGTVTTATQGCL